MSSRFQYLFQLVTPKTKSLIQEKFPVSQNVDT